MLDGYNAIKLGWDSSLETVMAWIYKKVGNAPATLSVSRGTLNWLESMQLFNQYLDIERYKPGPEVDLTPMLCGKKITKVFDEPGRIIVINEPMETINV